MFAIHFRIAALALLAIAPLALAQPLFFGEPVPQTDTRYGTTGAEPRLATNGHDFFLFWATDTKVRVTRLVDGQKRAGRPVLSGNIEQFDVVWTGTHFLVVADDRDAAGFRQIRGRLLSAGGETVGIPFTIVPSGNAPRVAFDGARVLMTYSAGSDLASMLLRPDGHPATDPRDQVLASGSLPSDSVVGTGANAFVAAWAHADDVVRITTFHPTGEVDAASQFAAPPHTERRVAMATDGADTLVVWTNGDRTSEGVTIRANGTISGRSAISGTEGTVDLAVAWNGTHWVVSTIANGKLKTRLLDAASSPELHTPVRAHTASPVSLASLGGRTLAAWRDSTAGRPVVVRDLAASGSGIDAAYAAADQTFHTATSSHEAVLAVWSEVRDGKHTLHSGVRTVDGGWNENRIGTDEDATLASSDGALFLVVKQTEEGWSAVTLSETGAILASTPRISTFRPTGIAWDGTSWVVIGLNGKTQVFVARVTRSGTVSGPVLIDQRTDRELEHARIAAGGGGFLAIWQEVQFAICFPVCDPTISELRGTRLTSDLQRVDALNLSIAPDEVLSPDLYWNGERFVIFWLDGGALETRTVRPDAAGSGTTRISGAQIDTDEVRVTQTALGATITSSDGEVLLIRNNALVHRYTLGDPHSRDALVNLGSDVAYLQAFVRDEMPYHGASRIFLRTGGLIARDAPPDPPKLTRAAMTDGGKLIVLEWTPPAGNINGYRIEYRVDDGTWNELDEWFDAEETSASIVPWLEKVKYQFRMRAWSDGGVSEYSTPGTVRLLGRRRAMR